ncbi:MAG TPA: triose-phosphate isomerase [Candidatus Polarisedimenticolia bacterium]|nr:triose-phosphate isomerase [Candidatus Polarisedimenticolia bacterium]
MVDPFVLANWKMYKTSSETEALLSEILPALRTMTSGPAGRRVDVAIAPPFPSIPMAARMLAGSGVSLSGQDCHWEDEGPYTGQVSPRMLAECGCRYVLLGHSERRELFAETDHRVNLKARAALSWGLTPILCVGEKMDERASGRAEMVVEDQLNRCLNGLELERGQRLMLAYEPVWAIGSGHVPSPSEVASVHHIIRRAVAGQFGEEATARIPILYGGSVSRSTVGPMIDLPVVDGVLVGGASLSAETFLPLVEQVMACGPQEG